MIMSIMKWVKNGTGGETNKSNSILFDIAAFFDLSFRGLLLADVKNGIPN